MTSAADKLRKLADEATPGLAVDPTSCTLRNGEWYAFDFGGRKFFATAYLNPLTGFLELTEIPDPYICKICDMTYQEGSHFGGGHEYVARGEKRTWKGDV